MTRRPTQVVSILGALLLALPLASQAGAITIQYLGDGVSDDGGNFNGFAMTDIDQQATTTPGVGNEADDVQSITSTGMTGTMGFQGQGGIVSDLDIVDDPSWWQFTAEHDNVYVTNYNWIEILLPENTLALTVWVGASFDTGAWIRAYDSDGDLLQTDPRFQIGDGVTRGYGISTDGCTYLTKIVVEPQDWGFGNLSISQGDVADSCVEVPEPPPLALFLTGILGLALTRQLIVKAQQVRAKR